VKAHDSNEEAFPPKMDALDNWKLE